MIRTNSAALGRFATDSTGSVKVEFVVVFPLILGWILTSFVFFDAYRHFSRSSKATYAVSDILSRRTSVDQQNLDELRSVMNGLIPWSDSTKWLRVTSLQFVKVSGGDPLGYDKDDDGVQDCYDDDSDAVCEYQIIWSRASGTNNTHTGTNPPSDILAVLPDIAEDDTVLLTETFVPYRPLLDNLGLDGIAWSNQQATRPRYISEIRWGN